MHGYALVNMDVPSPVSEMKFDVMHGNTLHNYDSSQAFVLPYSLDGNQGGLNGLNYKNVVRLSNNCCGYGIRVSS